MPFALPEAVTHQEKQPSNKIYLCLPPPSIQGLIKYRAASGGLQQNTSIKYSPLRDVSGTLCCCSFGEQYVSLCHEGNP